MNAKVGLPTEARRAGVSGRAGERRLEAPSGFEPEMEVLQTSALPLGYGARDGALVEVEGWLANRSSRWRAKVGAGNGIRTRDFDLGKVALYH